jgi:integrase
MFNRAIEWGLWTGINPGIYVKRKKPSRRKRYVMEGEQPALIREMEREPVMSRIFFYLCMFCANRPGEAERTKIADLKPVDTGFLWRRPTTKNGEEQWIPLPDPLPELLRRYLAVLPPQQVYLFQNSRRPKPLGHTYWTTQWRYIRKRAGLGPEQDEHGRNIKGTAIRIYDLRRTCSTRVMNAKDPSERLDLISLSKGVLNHADLNTTQIYAIPDLERIRQALSANAKRVLAAGGAVYPATTQPPQEGATS